MPPICVHAHPDVNLTSLFGPQHGIRGDVQDNMIETGHTVDRVNRLADSFPLQRDARAHRSDAQDVDVLVFDMQDVGCRIYTFAYTMANCMRAAKQFRKKVIVWIARIRSRALGVAGNILEAEQASFVGQFPIPTRHGMTLGELARCSMTILESVAIWKLYRWRVGHASIGRMKRTRLG